jgi:transketolase
VPLGAYTLADSPTDAKPDIILIATGSEVHLALDGRDRLATEGVQARVVSMPSTNLFAAQPEDYRENILPTGVPLLAIEAGTTLGWKSYTAANCSDRGGRLRGVGSWCSRDGALRLHCGERL